MRNYLALLLPMICFASSAWAQGALDLKKDDALVAELRTSAAKIKLFWNGKPVDEKALPKRPPCLAQTLKTLVSDLNEIRAAGTRVENGQRIATRHRFLYPLESEIAALNVHVIQKGGQAVRVEVKVEPAAASVPGGALPPVFSGSLGKSCDPSSIDLVHWMERATLNPKPSPSGTPEIIK